MKALRAQRPFSSRPKRQSKLPQPVALSSEFTVSRKSVTGPSSAYGSNYNSSHYVNLMAQKHQRDLRKGESKLRQVRNSFLIRRTKGSSMKRLEVKQLFRQQTSSPSADLGSVYGGLYSAPPDLEPEDIVIRD